MIAKDSKDVPSSSEACSGGRPGRCQMEEGASWPRWTEREGMIVWFWSCFPWMVWIVCSNPVCLLYRTYSVCLQHCAGSVLQRKLVGQVFILCGKIYLQDGHFQKLLPSRELTYPPKIGFWRWFSFSQGGICDFPGGYFSRLARWFNCIWS